MGSNSNNILPVWIEGHTTPEASFGLINSCSTTTPLLPVLKPPQAPPARADGAVLVKEGGERVLCVSLETRDKERRQQQEQLLLPESCLCKQELPTEPPAGTGLALFQTLPTAGQIWAAAGQGREGV